MRTFFTSFSGYESSIFVLGLSKLKRKTFIVSQFDMNEMQKKMKERIESEARATMRISNKDLICRDCEFVLDDSEVFGNVSRCKIFEVKPVNVLVGGECCSYKRQCKE